MRTDTIRHLFPFSHLIQTAAACPIHTHVSSVTTSQLRMEFPRSPGNFSSSVESIQYSRFVSPDKSHRINALAKHVINTTVADLRATVQVSSPLYTESLVTKLSRIIHKRYTRSSILGSRLQRPLYRTKAYSNRSKRKLLSLQLRESK
jgi:hypothetical protein